MDAAARVRLLNPGTECAEKMSIETISGSSSTRRSRVVLLLAAVLTAVYVVAPSGGIEDSIRVAAPIIAAGAVLFGIVIHHPQRATPWYLISTALVSLAAAHVSWTVLSARGDQTFPSIAEGFHTLFWCLVLLAVAVQIRDSISEGFEGTNTAPCEDCHGPTATVMSDLASFAI